MAVMFFGLISHSQLFYQIASRIMAQRSGFFGRLGTTSAQSVPPQAANTQQCAFYRNVPENVFIWPETEAQYSRVMTGVPFVFVGIRDEESGAVSGAIVVNACLSDASFWKKLVLKPRESGRALADIAAYNLVRDPSFCEVDVSVLYLFGFLHAHGGAVFEEAVDSELRSIPVAYQKFAKQNCVNIEECGILIQKLLDRSCPFLGASQKAGFVEWFLSKLKNAQDMAFVHFKPLVRPTLSA